MGTAAATALHRIATHVDSRSKGHKEDFSVEELEAAIELYEEHEEENKHKTVLLHHMCMHRYM